MEERGWLWVPDRLDVICNWHGSAHILKANFTACGVAVGAASSWDRYRPVAVVA